MCFWEELGASVLLHPICFYTNQHSVYFLRRPLDQLICALDTDVLLNTKLTVTVYANLFIGINQVLIEAVENHMPQAIVIDEIGTKLEAMAASTMAQRGIQLVATAHGVTIENLIMNPSLEMLVGGIQVRTFCTSFSVLYDFLLFLSVISLSFWCLPLEMQHIKFCVRTSKFQTQ